MPIDRLDTIASRPCNVVHEDVCQQLERELAEAKFDLQFRRDLYALQSKELAEAREQRDTMAEELDALKQSMLDLSHPNMMSLLKERKEAREQRDALVNILTDVINEDGTPKSIDRAAIFLTAVKGELK